MLHLARHLVGVRLFIDHCCYSDVICADEVVACITAMRSKEIWKIDIILQPLPNLKSRMFIT